MTEVFVSIYYIRDPSITGRYLQGFFLLVVRFVTATCRLSQIQTLSIRIVTQKTKKTSLKLYLPTCLDICWLYPITL